MKIITPLLLVIIASIGNAVFAISQKKGTASNPFVFLTLMGIFIVAYFFILSLFFPKENYFICFKDNFIYEILGAIGIGTTFLCFYFVYQKYDVNWYTVYAVASILTTSVFVGVIIFKEEFNIYYLFGIFTAIISIILFMLGKLKQ